jgi:hypothetical protein
LPFALHTLPLANEPQFGSFSRRQFLLICLALFLFAFAIRTLTWQDNRLDASKVQTSVTHRYKESARQLASGNFKVFLTDVDHLGHPPGYPILLAAIFKTVGESDTFLQFLQITVDSVSVVVLFLISLELFSLSVAIVAGFLAALSPQFAYFSVLLLPDSLIVLPILLAVLFVVKSRRRFRWWNLFIAGLLIGVSCWLRANALFLPLFIGAAAALTTTRGKRIAAMTAVIAGTIIAIAPVTIKNAVAFHSFIPLSLGSGQTLLEGLADYDPKGTLNIPNTDLGLTRQEAQWYGRPDYAVPLFGPDGIERDRMRVKRGLKTIGEHPFWFANVMAKRALASTRLDPVPVLRPESPVNSFSAGSWPVWRQRPFRWFETAETWPQVTITTVLPFGSKDIDMNWVRIDGNNENRGTLVSSDPIVVRSYRDYALIVPIKLERGRLQLKVMSNEEEVASTIVETSEVFESQDQPKQIIQLQFVSANNSQVRVVVANGASIKPSLLLGDIELYELGPSSMTWLRYLRMPLRLLQKVYTTAWTIPLLIVGLLVLIRRRQRQELLLLLAVPAYYLIVQSALHTERRYVYVIHFFFLVVVSVALCWATNVVMGFLRRHVLRPSLQQS